MHPESPESGRVPGEPTGPDAENATRPDLPAPGGPPAAEAGPSSGGNGRPPGAFRRGRAKFRAWRRSRPFWGGLLLVLAGLELLLIPVASLVVHGAIKIVIYIGIGGVFGVIFGCVLVACGLLSWFHPVQRVFYAIVGALLALGSFVVTNLGGFFLGMLLGVIGASLVFAWTPIGPQPGRRRRRVRRPAEPSGGLDDVLGEPPAEQGPARPGLLVLPVVPLALSGLLAAGQAPALSRPPATASRASCTSSIIPCSPSPTQSPAAGPGSPMPAASPSPSASRSPGSSASPSPSPSPSPSASRSPSPSASVTPSPSPSRNPNAGKRASASAALVAASVPASLTAGSALMRGLSYDGVANVPTQNGSQAMLKFSMTSLSLSGGIVLTVTENGHTMVTRNSSIDFSGSVVLYATQLCGDLPGVRLCFSPQKPPPLVLPVMTFTNVATDQPLTTAGTALAAGLDVTGH